MRAPRLSMPTGGPEAGDRGAVAFGVRWDLAAHAHANRSVVSGYNYGSSPTLRGPMRNLTLQDVKAALPDLLDLRVDALAPTHAGQIFLPMLSNLRRKLDALPEGEDGELVAELAREDARHDGYASALWYAVEAYLRMPVLEPGERGALESLRDGLLPRPSELSAPYAHEAALAKERAAALTPELRAVLERYPVRGGSSLLDWMHAYLESGERLQRLLSQRSVEDFGSADEPIDAGRLRGRAVGLLAQLRETLKHELHAEPERWQSIDDTVFSYIDQLSEHRARQRPIRDDEPLDETHLYGKKE
jgi:hypothetical protein